PIGESEEVDLVDGIEYLRHRPLHDLVFQRRNTERSLTTIRLGNEHTPHRQRPIPTGVNLLTKYSEIAPQVLLVGHDRHSVDPYARASLQPPKRARQRCDIDMMQERRKPSTLVVSRCFVHPLKMWQQST